MAYVRATLSLDLLKKGDASMFHVYQVSTRKYLGVVNAANMMDACLIGFQTFGVKYSDLVASVTLNPWG